MLTNPNFIVICLYTLIGFVPYFGVADKEVTQILYLNILNILCLGHIVKTYGRNFLKEFSKIFLKVPLILFFGFFIFCLLTIPTAININEAISTSGDIFTLLISFIIILYYFSKIDDIKKLVYLLIPILLCAEIVTVLIPYLNDIAENGKPGYRAMAYRGFTGNINIMAYLMLVKIPIILYLYFTKQHKFFYLTIITISVYIIFSILQTRSAILGLIMVYSLTTLSFIFISKASSIKSYRPLLKTFLTLVIAFLLNNFQSNFFETNSVQERVSTVTNFSEDKSLQQRLRYYKSAFISFTKHPILGVGIGNWEVESVNYEKEFMQTYVVPYHAHNDYLEVLAETGIIGFLLYFGFIFITVYKLFRYLIKVREREKKFFAGFLIISIAAYLFDSLFNFPFDRTIQQVHLILIISISISLLKHDIEIKNLKFRKTLLIFLILIIPASLYSSVRLFNYSQDAANMLRMLNNGDYTLVSEEEIDKYEMKYRNLTPTAMPMSAVKGMHYMKREEFNESVKYFKEGIGLSPHLYMSESFLGYSYARINELDSALYYTRKAFINAPNNPVHFSNYAYSLSLVGDSIEIKNAYESIKEEYRDDLMDELYLIAMNYTIDSESAEFALEDFNFKITASNDKLKRRYYQLKVGEDIMYEADYYYKLGVKFLEEDNFIEAANYFDKASDLNPFELPYKENAANAYMKQGNDQKALEILNELIDNQEYKTDTVLYLRGLILYGLDDKTKACQDLNQVFENGKINSQLFNTLCKDNLEN